MPTTSAYAALELPGRLQDRRPLRYPAPLTGGRKHNKDIITHSRISLDETTSVRTAANGVFVRVDAIVVGRIIKEDMRSGIESGRSVQSASRKRQGCFCGVTPEQTGPTGTAKSPFGFF